MWRLQKRALYTVPKSTRPALKPASAARFGAFTDSRNYLSLWDI
jgi:hypothetical protein